MEKRDTTDRKVKAFGNLRQLQLDQNIISPVDVSNYTHAMLLGLLSINRTAGNLVLAHMLGLALVEAKSPQEIPASK